MGAGVQLELIRAGSGSCLLLLMALQLLLEIMKQQLGRDMKQLAVMRMKLERPQHQQQDQASVHAWGGPQPGSGSWAPQLVKGKELLEVLLLQLLPVVGLAAG